MPVKKVEYNIISFYYSDVLFLTIQINNQIQVVHFRFYVKLVLCYLALTYKPLLYRLYISASVPDNNLTKDEQHALRRLKNDENIVNTTSPTKDE